MQEDCDAELELRALPAAAERAQRLCPFDCGEAGTCDLTAVAPGPSIFVDQTFPGEAVDADDGSGGGGSAAQPWLHIESHTVCRCQEGDRLGEASGPWCESKFAEPKLEYGLWTERAVLQPLQWRPHRIEISSAGDAPIRLELQVRPPSAPHATHLRMMDVAHCNCMPLECFSVTPHRQHRQGVQPWCTRSRTPLEP